MSNKIINLKQKRRRVKEYSKDEIEELLENYVRVDNIDEIPVNCNIRYVTLDSSKKQCFRDGGRLVYTTDKSVCLSRGSFKWYVKKQHFEFPDDKEPIFETIFWKKRDYMDDLLDHIENQTNEIQLLREQLNMCKEILRILKDDNKITKQAIELIKNQVSKCKEMCLSLKERKSSKKNK
jgi:hypothetical protein